MGRQPLGAGRRIDRAAMYAEAERLFRGWACTSTPGARPRACRSPTSRSSRSPRPSRSTPGSSSWTSRPRRSAASRSTGSSPWPAACATRAARWSSSPTASTRSSPSATRSRSCGTGSTSRPTTVAETSVDALVSEMVGREVAELFPKTSRRDRRAGPRGGGAELDRRLPRRLLPGPGRRDRGTGRPGRRRSQRDRPRGLRGRRATSRAPSACNGKAGRQGQPASRDPGRHGLHPRGPPQAGAGHRRVGHPQRRRGDPPGPGQGRPDPPRRGEQGRRRPGRPASR